MHFKQILLKSNTGEFSNPKKKELTKQKASVDSLNTERMNLVIQTNFNSNTKGEMLANDDINWGINNFMINKLETDSEMEVPEEQLMKELKKIEDKRKRKEILEHDLNPILYVRNVPSEDFYLIL